MLFADDEPTLSNDCEARCGIWCWHLRFDRKNRSKRLPQFQTCSSLERRLNCVLALSRPTSPSIKMSNLKRPNIRSLKQSMRPYPNDTVAFAALGSQRKGRKKTNIDD